MFPDIVAVYIIYIIIICDQPFITTTSLNITIYNVEFTIFKLNGAIYTTLVHNRELGT